MSNKTQLQINNTKYASLIETLRGKAAGGTSEDVTDETNAYTTKIASLEGAVSALESELAGKASGGSAETWAGTLDVAAMYSFNIHYTDSDGNYKTEMIDGTTSYNTTIQLNVLKNTLITFSSNDNLLGGPQIGVLVNIETVIDMYGGLYNSVLLPTANNFIINII